MTPKTTQTDSILFQKKLAAYKKLIDEDIERYAKGVEKTTLQQYGADARLATDAYLSILRRGGKRIRGALVMVGYEMSGGKDMPMIIEAARALEMMHAYILIIDDVQDRSLTRRGGPTAHSALAAYHRKHHWAGDSDHFGVSIALNAAVSGAHLASITMANLPGVAEEVRIKAVSIMNQAMVATAHGQTSDIMNEVTDTVTEEQVERVLEWKTANYTFLNPLCVGMVLAGGDCDATDAIRQYAIHAGKAFQITDDILSTFGAETESGKSPMDDLREGKRTILTVYALEHASNGNKNFLVHMLGNTQLSPVEFHRCKDILVDCGALAHAQQRAEAHIAKALQALEQPHDSWDAQGLQFLRGLAQYLASRKS